MTPEQFQRLDALYDAAAALGPEERTRFIEERCAGEEELRRELLAMFHEEASGLTGVVEQAAAAEGGDRDRTATFQGGGSASPRPDSRPRRQSMQGRRLGAYEVLREIGHGGMGTVYHGQRADGLYQQQVAIKVVTPESASGDIVERFEQEREILASLEHPNITRLYDGGSTEKGRPYFVMEYVEGKPIDRWCDERKLNVSERVRLFRSVCGAVQYAHQRRIIHRDLSAPGPSSLIDGPLNTRPSPIAAGRREAKRAALRADWRVRPACNRMA